MAGDETVADRLEVDLRGCPCPMNLVRALLAIEKAPPGTLLVLRVDAGRPVTFVPEGLRSRSYRVEAVRMSTSGAEIDVLMGVEP